MSDNLLINVGADASVATDDVSGVHYQKTKIDIGGDGVSIPLVGDATYGIPVDVKRITGSVTVVQPTATNLKVDASGVAVPITDNSGSITIDAPKATPAAVRLSDGTDWIAGLPVSGAITAAQGTAAAAAGGWPSKITDGTDTVGISTVGGAKALKVDVVQSAASSATDLEAFTQGTDPITPIGALYATSLSDPSAGQVAAVRATQKRALHVNLRADAGTEIGTSGAPVRVDPTGTTKQPVSLNDSSGTALGPTNPVAVTHTGRGETRISTQLGLIASQTGLAIVTPTSGKKFAVRKIILLTSVTGVLTLFDATNTASTILFKGTVPTGIFVLTFEEPFISATADNILKYTSGTGLVAEITIHGFEI